MNVQSACSSGLVAVAQAAQALQTGNCELAIAGAASLSFPNFGYMYGEGLVGSTDGKVRPFDANASGTLFGDAVGAVVLKRLEDAERDGDFVYDTFRLNFHHFDRFELGFREDTHVRGAAFSCLRFKLADMMLI